VAFEKCMHWLTSPIRARVDRLRAQSNSVWAIKALANKKHWRTNVLAHCEHKNHLLQTQNVLDERDKTINIISTQYSTEFRSRNKYLNVCT